MILLETNFYKLFYWITVSEGVKSLSETLSILLCVITIISGIGYFASTNSLSQYATAGAPSEQGTKFNEWKVWRDAYRKIFCLVLPFCVLFTLLSIFIPSKKDAIIIVAGGAVGNFIMSDSTSKQIPAELTLLVREKIKSEILELKNPLIVDTLKEKTKEELIELLKNK